MNTIESNLQLALSSALKKAFDVSIPANEIIIETPRMKEHGDYASNIALQMARTLHKAPLFIAQQLQSDIDLTLAGIEKIIIAKPGFLNFTIQKANLSQMLNDVIKSGDQYGKNKSGAAKKINLEYVSANPTGDLHLGHARGACYGDSVARLLIACGYNVTREYYVNDAGNQIHNLARSLQARYLQHYSLPYTMPEDGYYGDDVVAIANSLAKLHGKAYIEDTPQNLQFFQQQGIIYELTKIKADLANFRVTFDQYTSEQAIRDAGKVSAVLAFLQKKSLLYELDGALWFKTTKFGDDKDRVIQKKDGSYTYLVPDIAYHKDKFDRNYDQLIDVLGGDHHGYIARLKASVQALGFNPDALQVDLIQMVRLSENETLMKMSKRQGNAITLRSLCEEVGVDAIRYFFVQRSIDTHLDFDVALAKKQSNDNPVYYAQYAHARICSILSQSTQQDTQEFPLLTNELEVALMKRIVEYPQLLIDAAKDRSIHRIPNYIQKLAQNFHSFYNACKVNDPQNPELSGQRIALCKACKITLKNALTLIGVEAKEKM